MVRGGGGRKKGSLDGYCRSFELRNLSIVASPHTPSSSSTISNKAFFSPPDPHHPTPHALLWNGGRSQRTPSRGPSQAPSPHCVCVAPAMLWLQRGRRSVALRACVQAWRAVAARWRAVAVRRLCVQGLELLRRWRIFARGSVETRARTRFFVSRRHWRKFLVLLRLALQRWLVIRRVAPGPPPWYEYGLWQ